MSDTIIPTAALKRTYTHFHLFCGIGGGAIGFNGGQARVGRSTASGQCVGGVDSDPKAIKAFSRMVGVKGTTLDLFDRQQYIDFHGHAPPDGWREATADDIRKAAHGVNPDIVFTSPPCKGFSGLLNSKSSNSNKYQALNKLTVRGIALMLEAFADNPPSLIILENVPRIQTRGRHLLDEINAVLACHGYLTAETVHNCGELGGLAQNRTRFLMVARHREKVPPHLYEPERQPMKSIGDVIGGMPVPHLDDMGLHRLPNMKFQTWLRLALIKPGSDWRWLETYDWADGVLQGFSLNDLDVEDVRLGSHTSKRTGRRNEYGQYGVNLMADTCGTVTGKGAGNPGAGRYSVADVRLPRAQNARAKRPFNNVYVVKQWGDTTQAVTGGATPSSGGQAIGDVRMNLGRKSNHTTAGQAHFGVLSLDQHARAVTGHGKYDNSPSSVADTPKLSTKCRPLIVSPWATWNRPFTTLELGALQGYDVEQLMIGCKGSTQTNARMHIGNSVPPEAARAIASEFYETLLLAEAGASFRLSAKPIWCQPLSAALSIAIPAA